MLLVVIVYLLIAAVTLVWYWLSGAGTQRSSLAWALAAAADKEIPFGPALRAFAGTVRRPFRWKVLRLAQALEAGLSLPDALACVPGAATPAIRAAVNIGSTTGGLSTALRAAVVGDRLQRTTWRELTGRLAYLTAVLALGIFVVTFMFMFIVPKFKKIFADFGIELPAITKLYIVLVDSLAASTGLLFLGIAAVLGLIVVPIIQVVRGALRYQAPGFTRVYLARERGAILRCLALAVENSRPLDDSLTALAAAYRKTILGKRLQRVVAALHGGVNWLQALYDQNLIAANDAAVLGSANEAGNLPWAMGVLADAGERRPRYRVEMLARTAGSAAVLFVGLLIAFGAVAHFMPLVKIIFVESSR